MIVDSPGVGESDDMDETVVEYLPEAFAFIYVINCTNAGGVQKDRVSTNDTGVCMENIDTLQKPKQLFFKYIYLVI